MIITAGKYKGIKILAPDENFTRPTLSKIRESIFSMLFSIDENFGDKIFLDMFAGSGIMGLEALSRGFKKVYSFEKNLKVVKILKQNYAKLNLEPNLTVGDSLKKIEKNPEKAHVIYIDPPYLSGIYEDCLNRIKENSTGAKDGVIVLEHTAKLDLSLYSDTFKILKQKKYGKKFITFLICT